MRKRGSWPGRPGLPHSLAQPAPPGLAQPAVPRERPESPAEPPDGLSRGRPVDRARAPKSRPLSIPSVRTSSIRADRRASVVNVFRPDAGPGPFLRNSLSRPSDLFWHHTWLVRAGFKLQPHFQTLDRLSTPASGRPNTPDQRWGVSAILHVLPKLLPPKPRPIRCIWLLGGAEFNGPSQRSPSPVTVLRGPVSVALFP